MQVTDTDAWMGFARSQVGLHETGDNRGTVVQKFIIMGKCGRLGDPWCAIFTDAALEQAGIRSPRSPSSQSFRHDPNFVKIDKPIYGCIAVFWRQSPNAGIGHTGFVTGITWDRVKVLGGNEDDAVRDQWYAKNKSNWGLVGFYMPKGVPLVAKHALDTGMAVAQAGATKVT